MARSKNKERTASRVAVDIGSTGGRSVPPSAVILLVVCVLAAIWAVAMMTKPGRVGYVYFFMYAEYYMGVLTLVSLSITIMVGLVSTDRLVLSIRQRVFLQSTHRTTGVMAISSLAFHLWTKTVEGHIRVIDIFIPFIAQGNNLFYIGLGQISGYILVLVTWSGLIRARFIGRGKPWMWRAIHSISYLMWPIALVHGLSAGRAAKTWVIVSYVICVLLVLIGLAVRLSVSLNRRKDFASAAGVGAAKPSGNVVPTSGGGARGRFGGGRSAREQTTDLLAPAETPAVSSWIPAAPAAPPAAPPVAPVSPALAPISPAPFAGGRELEGPAPRQRRPEDDRYDEPTRAMPRREFEDDRYEEPALRGRRRDDDYYDEEPRPRGRRYADDEVEEEPRGRRAARTSMDDTSTRLRRDEMTETGTRLRIEDTGTGLRRDEMTETGTRLRRDEMTETGTRMRRYADDDAYYDEPARGRRRADAEPRYEDVPRQRAPRYEEDDEPRGGRRRADDGRHSRSEFVDLADDRYADDDSLVDTSARRARRPSADVLRGNPAGRGRARDDDDSYFSQLRGDVN
ncbi:Eukaryotic translation initiation factor 3 subunit A [Actinoplanes sp. SE50]|uniref:Eukaryotic translation initiation factor 3 subunit A n=1 Tax=unclassified Actinoplanes TaxID=2626549 RepID=UPI00023EBBEE|nr:MULTISPECIES: Eukaryotic translation initiation factor 3 subunit A [unclassified Actinoplanes]AEV86229.1 Eukaryotic translation initiation factor 3 subunit A [Actinoplanes sp. SE50/110]ATO84627.1 Eukaryotic translation initiation factor 3 subunit A [Actinoplanes sp. SE50]SLM02037.1 Eukaryotic translation initiation factor 3 subunit A [Actinoplanes sp. SE50/110]